MELHIPSFIFGAILAFAGATVLVGPIVRFLIESEEAQREEDEKGRR